MLRSSSYKLKIICQHFFCHSKFNFEVEVKKKKKKNFEVEFRVHRGSEYQPIEYQTYRSSDFKWFSIQMVGLWAMSNVLDRPFEYWTNT